MDVAIMHEGMRVGTAQISQEGLYWNVDCACIIDSKDVHRLWAHTKKDAVRLGVLMPEGLQLRLTKRLPVSAVCFTEECVITTEQSQLPPFCGKVGDYEIEDAYLLENDGKRTLCIPYRNEAFLLMEYICFFRLEHHGGRRFWMAELDETDFPHFC
ncbi:MAG: hypothetical protein IIY04_05305 [Oscillospiraceae bacterium]|nr:hypothetical protein [Oscillospiraceae bacterium]